MTRRVTLTFDNGPSVGVTSRILDELRRRQLLATFFVVGTALQSEGALDLARRAQAEGHWIGNHTMTHGTPLGLRTDAKTTVDEIAQLQTMLGPLAHRRKFFRPNGGGGRLGPHVLGPAAIEHLWAEAYTVVTWNAVPRDWEPPADAWVERALADIARQEATLLVLHDVAHAGAAEHLAGFLDELERRDVAIVQEFPAECVVIEAGRKTAALDRLLRLPATG